MIFAVASFLGVYTDVSCFDCSPPYEFNPTFIIFGIAALALFGFSLKRLLLKTNFTK